ncbi:MAG TPA: acyl-CoA dehydrogenase, partial [Candidatus Melainabacteria bacterium]|nr:acyl-CoA dehydrogenase [Candidatus Melainabacteria bacterium]
ELSEAMVKHQLKLPDRQCRIAEMSGRVQDTVIMIVTALWAHEKNDRVTTMAANILCQDLTRKLVGERPSDSYFRDCSKLADLIIEGEFKDLQGIEKAEIIFSYDKNEDTKSRQKAKA